MAAAVSMTTQSKPASLVCYYILTEGDGSYRCRKAQPALFSAHFWTHHAFPGPPEQSAPGQLFRGVSQQVCVRHCGRFGETSGAHARGGPSRPDHDDQRLERPLRRPLRLGHRRHGLRREEQRAQRQDLQLPHQRTQPHRRQDWDRVQRSGAPSSGQERNRHELLVNVSGRKTGELFHEESLFWRVRTSDVSVAVKYF